MEFFKNRKKLKIPPNGNKKSDTGSRGTYSGTKQEPMDETPKPPNTKVPIALRKLESNIDGKAWECTDTHRRASRVRTTGIQNEEEYQDNWDNTIPAENNETTEEDCSK